VYIDLKPDTSSTMNRTLHMAAALVALTVCLLACTPALDWRKVVNAQAGYSAHFPAKPVNVSREFVIAGETVSLNLQAATVGETYFAVGEIPLTPEQRLKAPEILKALQAAMSNNVGVAHPQVRTVMVAGVEWTEVLAQGSMGKDGRPAIFTGRFVVQPQRIIEIIALGEKAALTPDAIEQWFGGFAWGQN
jgi:hypothetical protein